MASAPPNQGFRFSGNLTAAGSDDAHSVVFSPGKSRGGGIQLSGTFSATIQFEQSLDNGTTWIAKTVYPAAGGAGVTSATATGQWKFKPGGESYIRVRCSAYVSGTITVDAVLTAGDDIAAVPGGTSGAPAFVAEMPRPIVATAAAMTRPANVTAYAAGNAVSNNTLAASVTPISFAASDINNAPLLLTHVELLSTDTGPATAGATFEVWLFNSDPTANSGVGGGNGAAFSQKQAGFIGRMQGSFIAASDGSMAICTPVEGTFIPTTPVSGGTTIYALLKTLTAFTPSANSTTFTATLKGVQGRA